MEWHSDTGQRLTVTASEVNNVVSVGDGLFGGLSKAPCLADCVKQLLRSYHSSEVTPIVGLPE